MATRWRFALIVAVFLIATGCGSVPIASDRTQQTESDGTLQSKSTLQPVLVPLTTPAASPRQIDAGRMIDDDLEAAQQPEIAVVELSSPIAQAGGTSGNLSTVEATATPVPEKSYMRDIIAPCTLWTDPDINPCDFGSRGGLIDTGVHVSYGDPLTLEEIWDERKHIERLDSLVFIPHIAVRATGLPGTVRCEARQHVDHFHSHRRDETASVDPREKSFVWVACFADFAVMEYIIGSGPPIVSIEVAGAIAYGDSAPSLISMVEPQVNSRFPGYEYLFGLGHSSTITFESFKPAMRFSVVIEDDGEIVGRSYSVEPRNLEEIIQEIKILDADRTARAGGRIAHDPNWPKMIRDANELQEFYVEAKAYQHPYATPQPPPAPATVGVVPLHTVTPTVPTPTPQPPTPTPLPDQISAITNLHVSEYYLVETSSDPILQADIGWCATDPRITGFRFSTKDHASQTWLNYGLVKEIEWPSQTFRIDPGETYTVAVETLVDEVSVNRAEFTFSVPEAFLDYVNLGEPVNHPCIAMNDPISTG